MSELAVIELPKENIVDFYVTPNGLDVFIKQIAKKTENLVFDMAIAKERDQLRSIAYNIAQSKTVVEKEGKNQAGIAKAKPKLIDAERKRAREAFDALQEKVRKPLTDWEDAEKKRVDDLERRVLDFSRFQEQELTNSDEASLELKKINDVTINESFEERQADAVIAKDKAISELTSIRDRLKKVEDEQAELEKLRAEKLEQERIDREAAIAKEAEERARLEAEKIAADEKAKAEQELIDERLAAERRELELKLKAEQAEKEKLQAEQRIKEADQIAKQKVIDDAAAEKAAAEKREANKRHNSKINNAALKAIAKSGITEDQAKAVVMMIAKGGVPNVSISY